ncbi:MAG: hypothetical protein DWQ05_14295 [Calditrichaeota bacterium]|nr:MAG: hypothetical protein DWQ05_14295 [Calditrichota bacterium]
MSTKRITQLIMYCLLSIAALHAQGTVTTYHDAQLEEINLGGPRLGFTYLLGDHDYIKNFTDEKIGTVISHFGWHFEYLIKPDGYGPSFVIEAIPLVSGVEYGILLPSATLAFGVRFPNGVEMGMGPNIQFLGEDKKGVTQTQTALTIAFGKSFTYGLVNLPVNFAFTTNPEGNRLSLVFGYAIKKKTVKHIN